MAKGLNAEFMRDVESFLKAHKLGVGANADDGNFKKFIPGVYEFDITDQQGHMMGYTALLNPYHGGTRTFSHPIRGYWCPYNQNSYYTIELKQGPGTPNYFFTPMIDGCSLVIGTGAEPKVGHFNYRSGGKIDSARMTTVIDQEFAGDPGARRWEKPEYTAGEPGGCRYTVIGVREGASWVFYAHKVLPVRGGAEEIHRT